MTICELASVVVGGFAEAEGFVGGLQSLRDGSWLIEGHLCA
jgi:hypothetical protein